MLTKKEAFNALKLEIEQKEARIQSAFDDLNSAVTDDSKSTAGDKHETGRAMVHLEQEKLSSQLAQVKLLKEALAQINIEEKHTKIQFGSLVTTNKGVFFFSIGLGKIKVNGEDVFCLTVTTPLGKALFGKKVGDKVMFNSEVKIESID
ncbi:MAG TPA: hypothetical protein EYG86_05690 [Crocinitomicaceae bacterium]|nr:hypothetical protein [Crocinitomicaceae bacterium]